MNSHLYRPPMGHFRRMLHPRHRHSVRTERPSLLFWHVKILRYQPLPSRLYLHLYVHPHLCPRMPRHLRLHLHARFSRYPRLHLRLLLTVLPAQPTREPPPDSSFRSHRSDYRPHRSGTPCPAAHVHHCRRFRYLCLRSRCRSRWHHCQHLYPHCHWTSLDRRCPRLRFHRLSLLCHGRRPAAEAFFRSRAP